MLTRSRISPYFLLFLLAVAGWASFRMLQVFLDYIIGACFLAYMTYPVYTWMKHKLRYNMMASLATTGLVTLVILGPLTFLVFQLIKELAGIVVNFNIDDTQAAVSQLIQTVAGNLPFFNEAQAEILAGQLVTILGDNLTGFASELVTGILQATPAAILGIFVLVYLLYYLYIDGPRLMVTIQELLPLRESHRDLLLREVQQVVGGVIYGHVLTSLIQGVLAAIGFLIFGVPGVALWSILMFVLALLPVVGPPLIWVPWGVYFLFSDRIGAGIGLLIYGSIFISGIDNFIRPKLIGDRAHVHPAVVLLGVLGGVALFGFPGIILGPLVLSVFVSILGVYRREFASEMHVRNL